MRTTLHANLLLILIIVSKMGFSQSAISKYAIVDNTFYNESLAALPGIIYLGQFSADSAYVKIADRKKEFSRDIFARIQPVQPNQKISYQWRTGDSLQVINIACYDKEGLENLNFKFINKLYNGQVLYQRIPFMSFKATMGYKEIKELLNDEDVKFISFEHPGNQEINFVERTSHRVSQFAPNFPSSTYLTGKGIVMGEWDGGDVGKHIDFDNRLTLVKNLGINSHATHVAGTMAGAGNLEPDARGMAPEAKIYSWDFNGDVVMEMDTNKSKLGYVLTQNSYGYWTGLCADFAQYDATSTDMDKLSIKYPDLLHVFAAGNSRSANCVAGGYKTILSGFQSAKNTISVAAVSSTDGDSYFSCAGPTQDGRFKPEISAVGVNVYSTQNNNTYSGGWNGTSMATPGASGSIALLYERFKTKYGYIPQNFLSKNIISNSADDIGNIGPDYLFGFGRINGLVAKNIIDSGFWTLDSIFNNGTYLDTIYIPYGLNELKVMLTWNDVEVNSSSSPVLVNDLDLTLTDSSGTSYSPWWCNPAVPSALAVRKRDTINNIEQVSIKNPPGGSVIIKVHGKNIPSGSQSFALTYIKEKKGLTVVYPNGNETMESPSNAAKAQLIRWDSKGVTGNYKLEFSRDNGLTWQSIATNIPNAQNYFSWQNLSDTITTGKALIRISNGTVGDISDAAFNISGLVSGITTLVCDSQVFLRWKKVPKTDFYRVSILKNGKMTEIGTPTDTSFVITGLSNGKAYWFSVSRRGLNGAESQRSKAITATPSIINQPPRVTLQPKDTFTCYNNLYFVKSKSSGTGPITSKWEYSNNNGLVWNTIPNTNDSINLKSYTGDFSFTVRRTYTNICLAPVYTRIASIRLDSLLDVKLYNRDSTVCKNSVLSDSVSVKSKIPSLITWYNDSLSYTNVLQKGLSKVLSNHFSRPMSIWAEVANLCGIVKTKDVSKPALSNGRNEYGLFTQPQISIKDTLMACIGESMNINPVLSGGRPGYRQLIFQTEDSVYLQNSLLLKITKDQWVTLYCFDNCYPDTTIRKVFIRMREPLRVSLNSDSTICFKNTVQLNALPGGGNGNYHYTWQDISQDVQTRLDTLTNSKLFKVMLTDNCTEKTVSDSVLISVLQPLDLTLSVNKDTLCSGNMLKLALTPSGGRVGTRVTTWTDNNLTGNTPSLVPSKSKWYPVTLSDGCSPVKTDSVYVYVREPLSVSINQVDTLCNGKSVILSAQYSGGLPGKQVIGWFPIAKTGQSVNYMPLESQDVIALISDGCTVPDVYDTMRVNAFDALNIVTQKDTGTCYGKSMTLTVKSIGGKSGTQRYYWQNSPSKTISVDSFVSAKYRYAVADDCKDSISQSIQVNVSPKLSISPSVIKKCSYSDLPVSFVVNTTRPNVVLWDKLPAGRNQIFKDSKSAYYAATLSDGCSDTSMVKIPVNVSDFSANDFSLSPTILKTATVEFSKLPFKTIFNWHDGNETLETGVKASHTYANYGQYTICRILQDEIGCSDTICKSIDNYDPSGFSNYQMRLYPNPVIDLLTFTMNQLSKDLSLRIADASGKIVYDGKMEYPAYAEYNIDMKGLASGVYSITVTSNGEVFTEKFLKLDEGT